MSDFVDRPGPQLMPKITSDGRLIAQISAGAKHVLCIGRSTGLSLQDEHRIELEARIDQLEKEQQQK